MSKVGIVSYGSYIPKYRIAVEEIAKVWGEDPNEIKSALERAKNSGKPAVIDVKTTWTIPDATKLLGSMGIL